jgi:hypothetical protein
MLRRKCPLDFGQDKVCGEIFGEGFEGEGVSIYY